MKKYIFTSNFNYTSPAPPCAKANPPCPYMPRRYFFKKGDIVEGTIVSNKTTSEPPNFIKTNSGSFVPFGGRGSMVIQAYNPIVTAIPIGKNDSPNNTSKTVDTQSFFTPKNIIIGVIGIGAIIGLLKWQKVI
jgi:hypothetical protein